MMEFIHTKRSYLVARDPSILSCHTTNLNNVRVNLKEEFAEKTEIEYTEEERDTHLNIFLRMKGEVPFEYLYKIDGDNLICKIPEGSCALRNVKEGDSMTKTFTFSRIFEPKATQSEIFNSIVKSKVVQFINGKNSTLLTYGASGSGKTFTIVGTPDEPGVIPRALEYLFRTLPSLNEMPEVKPLSNGDIIELNTNSLIAEEEIKLAIVNSTLPNKAVHLKTYEQMQARLSSLKVAEVDSISDVSVSIWVSFAEIYNEHIYDLLTTLPKGKMRPKLRLGNNKGEIYIKNLKMVHVSNGMEAYQVLQYGLHNLNYAATAINSHSSRSHSIFSMKLIQTSRTNDEVFVTSFNFCDLAGAERLKKTGNIGDRLKESNNINTSLLVLGRCIENVRNLQKIKDNRLIPFRDSKLTQLFQKALLGKENISMIVNINLSKDMFDESQHVLNFSAIAKDISIEVRPPANIVRKKNRFSLMLEQKPLVTGIKPAKQDKLVDEKEGELRRLHSIIDDLYSDIETLKQEHAVELAETEKIALRDFNQYINERSARFEAAKKKEIESIKEEFRNEIARLRESYQSDEVINISSSSDEASELEIENKHLKEKLASVKEEQIRTEQENKHLRADIRNFKKKLDEKETLLEEAKLAYLDIQEEKQNLKLENQKLWGELVLLKEKNEELGWTTFYSLRSGVSEEEESEEEESEEEKPIIEWSTVVEKEDLVGEVLDHIPLNSSTAMQTESHFPKSVSSIITLDKLVDNQSEISKEQSESTSLIESKESCSTTSRTTVIEKGDLVQQVVDHIPLNSSTATQTESNFTKSVSSNITLDKLIDNQSEVSKEQSESTSLTTNKESSSSTLTH